MIPKDPNLLSILSAIFFSWHRVYTTIRHPSIEKERERAALTFCSTLHSGATTSKEPERGSYHRRGRLPPAGNLVPYSKQKDVGVPDPVWMRERKDHRQFERFSKTTTSYLDSIQVVREYTSLGSLFQNKKRDREKHLLGASGN